MFLDDTADPVAVPRSPAAAWIERLLWLFMLSFAFDYRAAVNRAETTGSGLDQLLFLGLCGLATLGVLAIGWRHLLVRPGAWIILGWGGFLTFATAVAFLHGVEPGRSLRTCLPFALCLAGMMLAHIAACSGLRPSRIVAPVLAAACINVAWRVAHGFLFKDVSLDSVRVEILSPATNWLSAFVGCSLLLRSRFHWTLAAACGVLVSGILITVTRALIFPLLASAVATSLCFALGCHWRIFRLDKLPRRLLPLSAAAAIGLAILGVSMLAHPALIERWNERLFHHTGDRNLTQDVSWLTRRAEADSMMAILRHEPLRFIHGTGPGASYTWSAAYLPEIYLVYTDKADLSHDAWYAGHSTWTYALFSGGVIGVIAHLLLFSTTAVQGLRSAAANARLPGPDIWLAFLPFVATACFLSETATSNPFCERLAGMNLGIMIGLSQAFFVRAGFIPQHRSTPQA